MSQPSAEEKLEIVSQLPQNLLSPPDDEEIEFLTEELIKLAERMNRLCIGLMKAKSDRNHPLHVLASYLQLNAVELRAYLNGPRGS